MRNGVPGCGVGFPLNSIIRRGVVGESLFKVDSRKKWEKGENRYNQFFLGALL